MLFRRYDSAETLFIFPYSFKDQKQQTSGYHLRVPAKINNSEPRPTIVRYIDAFLFGLLEAPWKFLVVGIRKESYGILELLRYVYRLIESGVTFFEDLWSYHNKVWDACYRDSNRGFHERSVSKARSRKYRASFPDDGSGLLEINAMPDLWSGMVYAFL